MKIVKLTLVACVATALAASQVSAEVLYSDTFERVTGSGDGNGDPNGAADNFSDWGTNDNALGGSNSMAWDSGTDYGRPGGGRQAVTDGDLGLSHGTSSFYDFDAAAVSPNGFIIDLDFGRFTAPPATPPGPNGYIAFGLGVDAGTAITNDFHAIGASDWSILFQQPANGNAGNANVKTDNTGGGVNFNYGDPGAGHTLQLKVTPDVVGSYGDLDGITIDVLIDGTISQSFPTTGGANFGSFTVSANNFEPRFIDNLVVSSIPEPTTLAMAGLALVAGLARRRS